MKKNIKVVFKDNKERVFNANTFKFRNDGFCRLCFKDENNFILVACVSTSEIKYLKFVEVEE